MSAPRIYPPELKRQLERELPRCEGIDPTVRVTPRDGAYRKCAVWSAKYLEVQVFYTYTATGALDRLEQALQETPGAHLTTQVRARGRNDLANEVTNPRWPEALGTKRRHFHDLRPQVLALLNVLGVALKMNMAAPLKSCPQENHASGRGVANVHVRTTAGRRYAGEQHPAAPRPPPRAPHRRGPAVQPGRSP